ncbi:MAG: hypothetical protein GDA54_04060 [Alphaproteobacteria bacterium GM7ARS4]|nr:hypothetical protein [Alphaproteobacteria bacterium GM7ARS4]
MKLIAVIDMRGGYGVRASAGMGRGCYPFLRAPFPVRIVPLVDRLYHAYGFRHIYIADLDALMGKKEAWVYYHLYRMLEGLFPDVTFYVDGGFRSVCQVRRFYRFVRGHQIIPVICTECFCGTEDWIRIKRLMRGRVVLSLDYRNDYLLGGTYIGRAVGLWSSYMLVMALDAIGRGGARGMKRGGAIQERGRRYGSEQHFKGCFLAGGVGCFQHLVTAQEQGFAGVLLSSTLYGGVFSASQLQNWNKSLR